MDSKLFEFLILPLIPFMALFERLFPKQSPGPAVGVGILLLAGLGLGFYGGLVATALLANGYYALAAYIVFFFLGWKLVG